MISSVIVTAIVIVFRVAQTVVVPPVPACVDRRVDFFEADAAVVNFVKTLEETRDAWGRVRYEPHQVVWVSFWSDLRLPVFLGGGAIPYAIDHGWWAESHLQQVSPATGGWMLESADGVNVTARRFVVITSDHDWEMRNRRIYRPFVRE